MSRSSEFWTIRELKAQAKAVRDYWRKHPKTKLSDEGLTLLAMIEALPIDAVISLPSK